MKKSSWLVLLLATICAVAGLISYLAWYVGIPWFCSDTLFTKGYAYCHDSYNSLLKIATWGFSALSLFLFLAAIFFSLWARGVMMKFLKIYIPLALFLLIGGAFSSVCLGWLGCSSLLNSAIGLAVGIFIAGMWAIVFSIWFPQKVRLYMMIILFVLFAWGIYSLFPFRGSLKSFVDNPELSAEARRTSNIALCENAFLKPTRDRCIEDVAIQQGQESKCDGIHYLAFKDECVSFIIRNRAVDALDESLCKTIPLPGQQGVCFSLIQERKQLQSK